MGRSMKRKIIPAIIGLLVIVTVTIGVWICYNRMINTIDSEEVNEANTYSYHYVLIVENTESNFWDSVYEIAKAEAAKNDAYLEFVGGNPISNYTISEYMEISIAAQVDGIIVESNGQKTVEELIEKAGEKQIPVVTVMKDSSNNESSRKSFVGINSYEFGQAYGEAICQFASEDTKKVLVLLKGGTEDAGTYAYMKTALKELLPGRTDLEVGAYEVDSKTSFDAEEIIRDIFLDVDLAPDILVCLDEVYTECAYYAAIDYNKVGVVDIIGFYPSETIMAAIEKGIVLAAFKLDTEKIGKDIVGALAEFKQMGYVSDYYSVDIEAVTRENVHEFRGETP